MNDHKALIRRWADAINTNNVAALAGVVDVQFVDHQPLPDQTEGLAGLMQAYEQLRAAFPDWRVDVERIVVENDIVVVHSTWHGTHHGEFFTIPPTGASFTASAVDMFRIANNTIVERWGVLDLFAILLQLGVVPPLGASGGSTRIE